MKQQIATICLFALFAACSGVTSAPADMTEPAPDLSIIGPYSCSRSVADYCAAIGDCPSDAAALPSRWCVDGGLSYGSVQQYTCGADVVMVLIGVDTSTSYVFDATGQLVGVLGASTAAMGCDAGPTTIELVGCGAQTTLCGC